MLNIDGVSWQEWYYENPGKHSTKQDGHNYWLSSIESVQYEDFESNDHDRGRIVFHEES